MKADATPLAAASAPRLRLVVQSDAQAGTVIPCRRVLTLIGSRPGCKIQLQHPVVAPVHVALVNNGSQLIAADLFANRGTKLNGLKLEQEQLNHGDTLTVGSWEFRVEIMRPPEGAQGDSIPFELDQSPEAVGLEHLGTGRVLHPGREVCVIGRRSGCDIHIADRRVSRVHALLLHYYGFPALCDLLSKTGTYVAGEPTTYRLLKDQDIVQVGDARFRVRMIGSKVGQQGRQQPTSQPAPPIELESDDEENDLVDIATVEGSQRWRVADNLEKLSRK